MAQSAYERERARRARAREGREARERVDREEGRTPYTRALDRERTRRTERQARQAARQQGDREFGSGGPRVTGSFLKGPRASQHVLMAEMIAYGCIVAVRAVADYSQHSSGTAAGTETPSRGATPAVLLVAGLVVYFLLALVSAAGGNIGRAAALFGGVVVLALVVNSAEELDQAATWVEVTHANASPVITPDAGGKETA